MDQCLYEIGRAFEEFIRNFPAAWARGVLRAVVFPLGNHFHPVSDSLNAQVADLILEHSDVRERLSWLVFKNGGKDDPFGRMEHAWYVGQQTGAAYPKFLNVAAPGAPGGTRLAARSRGAHGRPGPSPGSATPTLAPAEVAFTFGARKVLWLRDR